MEMELDSNDSDHTKRWSLSWPPLFTLRCSLSDCLDATHRQRIVQSGQTKQDKGHVGRLARDHRLLRDLLLSRTKLRNQVMLIVTSRFRRIVTCIGPNQKIQPNLDLYLRYIFSQFLPAAMAGRSRSHFVTHSVSHSVNKTQMSHLETSNADSAKSKDVWNEKLEFLMGSADCLLSADCLQNPN